MVATSMATVIGRAAFHRSCIPAKAHAPPEPEHVGRGQAEHGRAERAGPARVGPQQVEPPLARREAAGPPA